MIKIVAILLVALAVAQAAVIPGYTEQRFVTDSDLALARKVASQLGSYTGTEGEYTILSVRNLQTQVELGNYRFTLDVLIATPENEYLFRTCDIAVQKQPFDFLEIPTCGLNPQYPKF